MLNFPVGEREQVQTAPPHVEHPFSLQQGQLQVWLCWHTSHLANLWLCEISSIINTYSHTFCNWKMNVESPLSTHNAEENGDSVNLLSFLVSNSCEQ